MKIRADLHVNGDSRKLILVPGDNEKTEHLALKLAAYVMFWDAELVVDASAKHPALLGQEFRPDLMSTDDSGTVNLWIEVGTTSLNKLDKVLKRFPYAHLVVIKENPAQARRFKVEAEELNQERLETLCFPDGAFAEWFGRLEEKTEVVGEATRTSMNLVVNDHIFVADLLHP
ncbi:MAG: YaeQ family protein [Elusimicrobia bacterium]|nr:YaeQ family protein [Elusimicrobiota bacterium]